MLGELSVKEINHFAKLHCSYEVSTQRIMSLVTPNSLSAADYAVFGVTLGISAAIGIFYAIKDRRSDEGTEGYLLGGRSMGMVPIALSLSISYCSAISVLGTAAEIYLFGTVLWWFALSMLFVAVITAEVYVPVFFRLKLTTIYEYIEQRFNRPVRILSIVIFMTSHLLYIGIVIYAPSLALSAVTGFNLWASILSTGLVCIFYTTLGGFKAVIWTDVFQAFMMVIGFLAITIQGSIKLGGYENVWKISKAGGRITFDSFDGDPRYRYTFWSIVIGGTFYWMPIYGIGQSQVQRYLSCKSLKQARGSVYLTWIGVFITTTLFTLNGTIVYAFYHDCDPLKNKQITAYDQLLPYISLELFRDYPGVSGLVVSSVFSGSLSTISTGINAMACVTVEDLVKPWTNWSETKYTWFTKGVVIIFGLASLGAAYLTSQLGGLIQAALSILGLTAGPVVALFTLGFMFSYANSLGVFVGTVCGLIMPIWIFIGSKVYPPRQEFMRVLPTSTAGCPVEVVNGTTISMTTISTAEGTEELKLYLQEPYPPIANLYAVSSVYYGLIGFCISMIVSVILSLLTGGWRDRKSVDPSLLYFFFDHWSLSWLPSRFRRFMRCGVEIDETKNKHSINVRNGNDEPGDAFGGISNDAYVEHSDGKMISQM